MYPRKQQGGTMDTNTLNLKFKLEKIELEILKKLIGVIEEPESITESVEVQTTSGLVRVASNNKIDLKIPWINETSLLKNNTLKVTVSYPKFFNNDNGYIIKNQSEIKTVQSELKRILEGIFLIKIDEKNSIHSRIDYPINLEIEDTFKDWGKIFVLIAKATQFNEETHIYYGVDQNKKIYTKGAKIELSESLEINFYNQRENLILKKKRDIKKEILRIETKLKRDWVIEQYLGTNKLKEVTFKAIKEVSKEIVKANILDKIPIELARQKEYLKGELIKHLEGSQRQGQNKIGVFVLKYQSQLIDFEMIEKIILELETPQRTKTKYIEQAKQELLNLEGINQERYFNNFNRINFLFWKVLGKSYKEFNIKNKF